LREPARAARQPARRRRPAPAAARPPARSIRRRTGSGESNASSDLPTEAMERMAGHACGMAGGYILIRR